MLVGEKLGLVIKGKHILDDVNISLQPGQLYGVLGANGAGKSSLLKILSNEIKTYTGKVQLNGTPIQKISKLSLAKSRAVLSQQLHLSFPIEVLEIVKMGRFPYGSQEDKKQTEAVAVWCLEQVGMYAFKDRDMLTLSGGEQQRVHLARIIAQLYEPSSAQHKFCLLDEPLANLDIVQQHAMLGLVVQLAKKLNLGFLVILHDINLAAQYMEQLAFLKGGKMIAAGPTSSTLNQETFRETYGIDATIHHQNTSNVQVTVHPMAPKEINSLTH
ncbi:MAG: heme ABC transporter ATP-binding protein [Bacteroidota bacterium]